MRVGVGVRLRALAFGAVDWVKEMAMIHPFRCAWGDKGREVNKRSTSEVSSHQNSW